MIRFTLTTLFFCSLLSLSAQNLKKIDSLRNQLSGENNELEFKVLCDLAWEYRMVSPDSTIAVGKRAFDLGKSIQLKKGLASPLNFIGVGYEYKALAADAYHYFNQALTTATDQNDSTQIAYANNNLGRVYLDQGYVLKSLEAYQIALSVFNKHKDLPGIAFVNLSLAQYYQAIKEFKKAEDCYLKVIDIRSKLENGPNISSITQLGVFYRETGDLIKSNKNLLKADSLCEVRKNVVQRAYVNYQLSINRLLEEKFTEGEFFAKKAVDYSLQTGLNTRRIYSVLGKIKFQQGYFNQSKEYFKAVLKENKTFRDTDIRLDAYYYLAKIYDKEGSYEKKIQNENLYLSLKDSLSSIEMNKQIQRMKLQFSLELEQKQAENELLRALDSKNNIIIKKQQTINTIYGVALVIIIAIAFLQYRNAKIKNQLNIELEKKQEKILRQSEELLASHEQIEKINNNLEKLVEERTRTIKEKNKLLREYAYFNSHQIRGPLARILGLISVVSLEYKGNLSTQMQMLQQAGNDLDGAIHHITKLIDDVNTD